MYRRGKTIPPCQGFVQETTFFMHSLSNFKAALAKTSGKCKLFHGSLYWYAWLLIGFHDCVLWVHLHIASTPKFRNVQHSRKKVLSWMNVMKAGRWNVHQDTYPCLPEVHFTEGGPQEADHLKEAPHRDISSMEILREVMGRGEAGVGGFLCISWTPPSFTKSGLLSRQEIRIWCNSQYHLLKDSWKSWGILVSEPLHLYPQVDKNRCSPVTVHSGISWTIIVMYNIAYNNQWQLLSLGIQRASVLPHLPLIQQPFKRHKSPECVYIALWDTTHSWYYLNLRLPFLMIREHNLGGISFSGCVGRTDKSRRLIGNHQDIKKVNLKLP